MANPLKQLAGETAIYGFSSILARILNFLFVPIYTRTLTQMQYGVVTEFMAYIAILQVVLVLGLETGCFRYANKEEEDPRKVYSGALLTVFGLNLAFLACMVAFSEPLSAAMGYVGYKRLIIYVASILFCDSITAILFAKLRQEHKAVKFAVLKTVKILTETGANLVLFFVYPAQPDFTYPIFAILISCVLCLVLFVPDILRLKLVWDGPLVKRMLVYSLPLMIAALPGVANDFLDRVLFRFFDTSSAQWQATLGVYQAAVKLAVIMNLFIQMFRYAAEPFFFQRAKDKGSKELYAVVMEYFTAFCGLVLLGVVGYIDVISLFLGRDFRVGIDVVPIMLLSYMLLGMLFNVSMWYKLSGKTNMAIWITLAGLHRGERGVHAPLLLLGIGLRSPSQLPGYVHPKRLAGVQVLSYTLQLEAYRPHLLPDGHCLCRLVFLQSPRGGCHAYQTGGEHPAHRVLWRCFLGAAA